MSAFVAQENVPATLRPGASGGGLFGKAAAFFSVRSLRIRLVLIVVAIDAVAAAMTGGVIVLKARTATELEIASSMQLAEAIVTDTIRILADAPAPILLKSIDLHFQPVRHVKISIVDEAGHMVESRPRLLAVQDVTATDPPGWFVRLVGLPIETKEFPILIRGQKAGLSEGGFVPDLRNTLVS